MEGSTSYLDQLNEALDRRRSWIASEQVPRLRESLTAYETLFEGIVALLIRKGLLREDPYHYEQVITEITIPNDDLLPEFESSDELSYRLAAYRRQLKYVSTDCPLDLESLNLARLKKLSALLAYINWRELGEASKSPTTKAFARAFMKVRMGQDSIAAQILKDSENQIQKTAGLIRSILGDLVSFDRESWKADIRREVLPGITLSEPDGRARREELLRAIRRGVAGRMSGKPWYPTLAEEVVDEELAEDGEQRRSRVLQSLVIPVQEKPKPVEPSPDGRLILLEAVRILSRSSEDLSTAIAILEENERLVRDPGAARGGWLRRLFRARSNPRADSRVYKVQYAEPGVPKPRSEEIDFPRFLAEVAKKSSLLAALATGSGPAYRRLASTSEAQLASFVDRQLDELLLIHRRLGCMNALLQARVAEEKMSARGIKIELLTIKNAIVKSNQRRHEYRDREAAG